MLERFGPPDAALDPSELEQEAYALAVRRRLGQPTGQQRHGRARRPSRDGLTRCAGERLDHPRAARSRLRQEKVHGDLGGRCASGGEELGGAPVQADPLTRRQRRLDGVAHDRVLEPQRPRVLEHPRSGKRGRCGCARRLVEAGKLGGERQPGVVAEHGRRPGEDARVRAEPRDPREHGGGDRLRPDECPPGRHSPR